jgi:hypothetical protein
MRECEDAIDRAARYAQRGRRHKHLGHDELGQRWAEAFRATVAQPGNETFRLAEQDLFAEHQLRRLAPPYEAVSAARDKLIAQLTEQVKKLNHRQLATLQTKRTRASGRRAHEKQLERAEEAVLAERARVAKQRALLRTLGRRHSPQTKPALQALQELERSLMKCEESRDYYASLLWRWS